MKIMKYSFCILVVVFIMSSCYSSRVLSGNVSPSEPLVEVKAKKNHFLLWGLVSLNEPQKAKDLIGDKENYVIQTSWTFVDGLLNIITLGIYTPTTTAYYLPFDETTK